MDDEALGHDLEYHFKGEKNGEDLPDDFELLVPIGKVVSVVVVVDGKHDRVESDQKDDQVLEHVRTGDVHE